MARSKSNDTFKKIYALVSLIPSGRVATYGQIAAMIGQGMPARIVGFALNGLPDNHKVPWHRVINSRGTISYASSRGDHDSLQRLLLEREGVEFDSFDKIDLEKFLWQPINLNK